jgi:hypothetical protein
LVDDGEHYGRISKTKSRKGEQMKKLALLSVVLMLASAVFAPVALAQEPGEVDVQSVTLGPGGSVTVTATVECVEGQAYDAFVTVRQRTSGNVFLVTSGGESGVCPTTGPVAFTFTEFGQVGSEGVQKPFHKGQAVVSTFGRTCDPVSGFCGPNQTSVEEVRIR